MITMNTTELDGSKGIVAKFYPWFIISIMSICKEGNGDVVDYDMFIYDRLIQILCKYLKE